MFSLTYRVTSLVEGMDEGGISIVLFIDTEVSIENIMEE